MPRLSLAGLYHVIDSSTNSSQLGPRMMSCAILVMRRKRRSPPGLIIVLSVRIVVQCWPAFAFRYRTACVPRVIFDR